MDKTTTRKLIMGIFATLTVSAITAFFGGAWGASHQLTKLAAEVQTLQATDQRLERELQRMQDGKLDKRQHDELVSGFQTFQAQNAEDHRKIIELLAQIAGRK